MTDHWCYQVVCLAVSKDPDQTNNKRDAKIMPVKDRKHMVSNKQTLIR